MGTADLQFAGDASLAGAGQNAQVLATWSDTWLAGPGGAPIMLHHDTCDHDTTARLVCAHCDTELELADVSATLGPGYPPKLRSAAKATGFFRDSD